MFSQAAAAGGLERADASHGGRVVALLRGAPELQEVLSAAGALPCLSYHLHDPYPSRNDGSSSPPHHASRQSGHVTTFELVQLLIWVLNFTAAPVLKRLAPALQAAAGWWWWTTRLAGAGPAA